MLPKMKSSALSLSIFSGKVDPKFCMELGAAIMYNKPLVLLVLEGVDVPPALERMAAAIVRGSMDDPQTREQIADAIKRVLPHEA